MTAAADKTRNLMQRLVALRLGLGEGKVAKGGTAPAVMGGFKFIEWDVTAPKLGALFAEHGIVPWPSMESYEVEQAGTTSSGKPVYRATVWLAYTFFNADDRQDQLTLRWVGVGDDTSDKGAQKAATSAAKYALLKAFLLGGANEADGGDAKIGQAATTQAQRGTSTGATPAAPARAASSPRPASNGARPVRQPIGVNGRRRACPECGDGNLDLVLWPDGNRQISCSNWQHCKYRERVPDESTAAEHVADIAQAVSAASASDVDPDDVPF